MLFCPATVEKYQWTPDKSISSWTYVMPREKGRWMQMKDAVSAPIPSPFFVVAHMLSLYVVEYRWTLWSCVFSNQVFLPMSVGFKVYRSTTRAGKWLWGGVRKRGRRRWPPTDRPTTGLLNNLLNGNVLTDGNQLHSITLWWLPIPKIYMGTIWFDIKTKTINIV